MKICIVGAGTAGLVSARHAVCYNLEPTIFELSNRIGGTWVYNDKVGIDNGIDVHSSMYQNLRTNLPKEVMGFPDFDIKGCDDSYVTSQKICSFLEDYADHFLLRKYIHFNTYVLRILKKKDKWQVININLISNEVSVLYFDYVMIGTGHYHTARYPSITGYNQFMGTFLHSHDFRTPECFRAQSVLVIGAGPSGMDLSNIISKTARCVTLSHHINDIQQNNFFGNVSLKPDILMLTKNGAYFLDGSYDDFDIIFFCTGYKYAFPFLSVDCGISVEDNYVQDLYKHCINIKNPTMALIGIPFYVCAAQMMDLQSRFVLKHFIGLKRLPSCHEMIEDTQRNMNERWQKGYKKRQAHMMGPEQINYYNDLSETAQIVNLKPVITYLHNESSKCFNENLLHFREDIFRIVDDETFVKIN